MRRDLNKRRKRGPRLLDRLMLRLSTGEQFDRLWIGALDDEPEPMLHRLREALQLIKTYDPLRLARLTRDLKRIWVSPIASIACFNYRLDACQLNERFVLAETTTPELLASAIVHEATHARIWGYGIGYEAGLRPRVEAICVRRQLAFAGKLPNGQRSREWAEATLAWCNRTNLSSAAGSRRRDDWKVEELRRRGFPDSIIRGMFALRRAIRAAMSFVRRASHPFASQGRS
jgi:hypothetical protein